MKRDGQEKGTIFDIRRFSTHDGEGIRTTLFLKGCPLSCVWCHNPEGIQIKKRVLHFPKKCIQCGICCQVSNDNGVELTKEGVKLHYRKKENWELLIRECPTGALVWDSREVTVGEIVQEILKDQIFFKHGGGITLSGGEPLLQHKFVLELLKKLKDRGVHTAIETALFVPEQILKDVLPYLDFMYIDLKLFERSEHIKYTKVSNDLIKSNIKFLLQSEKKENIIVRTPMIPGITDTVQNISSISQFISSIYKDVRYELLNYNPLAKSKYHLIDKTYYFKENPSKYSKTEMKFFANVARENGVHNIILDI